ncbi:MAG: Crp/Fnr family transcriptional regulator [Chloroflexota bacterium]|nr:Crp/Fnr family transcriptional regulator [Chloroflexota bacterium]
MMEVSIGEQRVNKREQAHRWGESYRPREDGMIMAGNNRSNKVWYLRHLDLFLSLTDSEIEEIARVLDDHPIPAGAELIHDRRRERIYLIKTGAVRLYTEEQGQQATLALLGPGRLFGLSGSFGNDKLVIGAVTLEPTYICFAALPKLLSLFNQFPEVMTRMTQALAEQIFVAETWIERTSAMSPRARLAALLLDLCADFCEPFEGGYRVKFRVTQADLARMINVTRETVSRVVADFMRAGWIERRDGRLVIRDQAALQHIASGAEDV